MYLWIGKVCPGGPAVILADSVLEAYLDSEGLHMRKEEEGGVGR